MARSDQPVRGAAAACRLLHREQPDGALHIGVRTIGRPCLCGQGGRLRHSRHHDRRNGPRPDRRGIHVGRRSRPVRGGARAHRARVDEDVRARTPRRHVVSGQGAADCLGVSEAVAGRLRGSGAATRSGRREIRLPLTRGGSNPLASSVPPTWMRYKQEAHATGRERSARDHRRALAGAAGGGHARLRRRLDAGSASIHSSRSLALRSI